VKQWSSKDNDIIAAAKKMALLMAKLSQLVSTLLNSSSLSLAKRQNKLECLSLESFSSLV
jgi:vinculin